MTHYILQLLVFQLLFLAVYDLFLKRETFFNANRLYLVLTPLLSFVLPLIKVPAFQRAIPENFMVELPAVFISEKTKEISASASAVENIFSFQWEYIWYLGIVVASVIFMYKLFRILKLKRSGEQFRLEDFEVVQLPGTDVAFTFLNTVFLGADLSEAKKESILQHEKIHIAERHSLDLLWFELLRIVCWFNPLIYVYQKRMVLLQEYIADAKVVAQKDRSTYYEELLSQVFNTDTFSFVNTFFNHSLIKNRIVMLQKSRSKKIVQLRYLLLIPVVGAMLLYSSCSNEGAESNTAGESSDIIRNIEQLKESIAAKGNVTKEEAAALEELRRLTAEAGGKEVHFEEKGDGDAVPFFAIQTPPTFPDCTGDAEALKKCMAKKINALIGNEFNVKLANEKNLSGRQKIAVQFKIDKNGEVVDIRARAAHASLEAEAIRVISKIPKMIPGEHEGKKVSVIYSVPIVFEIEE
ncbi:M56 family metallopeptidase [Constantimarinum furrinae]|uniref:BlaR1 peptidase M56 family protein n=1 Tax=Constantimarinum furrinae TaxID=2562285 RepID=A0A7G8PS62_9FLAO|nr:M56 family metallopeptidase [Constantimarinum furrinae]QNJ97178.1 BlaR1 peptidase M56 family protein [Constantimarinum furrinae]